MTDNIDREKLLAKIDEAFFETDPDGKEQIGVLKCRAIIRKIPAADVAPVVHGRWIADGDGYHWTYNCSICAWKDGYPFNERHNFCPNCGARMDGDAERRHT